MRHHFRFEELEPRIAPVVIGPGGQFDFADSDGDTIHIAYDGPDGSTVEALDADGNDLDDGDDIGYINVANSDWTSLLTVEWVDGPGGTIDVVHSVHYVTPGRSTGIISLGAGGTLYLGTGATIEAEGAIDTLILHGDLDFDDLGHSITANGNIGMVAMLSGDIILDPTNNAEIYANDISFILLDGRIYTETAGSELSPLNLSSGMSFADDAADGTVGEVSVAFTGAGATGTATYVPIAGGGHVLAGLDFQDADTITFTGVGRGGDVTEVTVGGAVVTSVTLTGAADMDIYNLSDEMASGHAWGAITNRTLGGDIVGVTTDTSVGSITTGSKGVFGAACTATGPGSHIYHPAVVASGFLETYALRANGNVGAISAGSIVDAHLYAQSIASIRTVGGIRYADIEVEASIPAIQAAYITDTCIYAEGGFGTITVGSGGITASDIEANGNITLVKTTGSIRGSIISAQQEDGGGNITGGGIGSVQAAGIFDSELKALGGFGSVIVKGTVASSAIDARFFSTPLGQDVGGPIGAFTAAAVNNSAVDAIQINSVLIGPGGLIDGSTINAVRAIPKIAIKGDVAHDCVINSDEGLPSVTIGGDLAYDAAIGTSGNLGTLAIAGQILGGDIVIAGDAASISVKGGVTGFGATIAVGGDVGTFLSGSNISGEDILQAGEDASSVNIEIDGNVTGKFSVNGGVSSANIGIYGNTNAFSIAGMVNKGQVLLEGNVGSLVVKGDVNNSDVTIGADGEPATAGTMSFGGSLSGASLIGYGNASAISVKGAIMAANLDYEGDVTTMTVGRGIYYTAVRVQGDTAKFTVGTAVERSQTLFWGGVAEYVVKGNLYYANVGTTHYDGGGNPLGGAIGKLTATDIDGTAIFANGGIGSIATRGVIWGASIETVGRDNGGLGDIVGGGAIGSVVAKGIADTDVLAYSSIGSMILGDEGISAGCTVATVTGNLGSITTGGLIFGDIVVAGNVTGNILTAGDDAVSLGNDADYCFRDQNGMISGGTLTVDGTIGGVVS